MQLSEIPTHSSALPQGLTQTSGIRRIMYSSNNGTVNSMSPLLGKKHTARRIKASRVGSSAFVVFPRILATSAEFTGPRPSSAIARKYALGVVGLTDPNAKEPVIELRDGERHASFDVVERDAVRSIGKVPCCLPEFLDEIGKAPTRLSGSSKSVFFPRDTLVECRNRRRGIR